MSFADEVRNDILALVTERGFEMRLWSETVSGSGPRPTFVQESVQCKGIRQNNVRRFSPWAAEDGDAMITMYAGPYPGIMTQPEKGYFVDFLDIAPGSTAEDGGQYGYTQRWNVIQSRDRRIDGELVAFTLLVRR